MDRAKQWMYYLLIGLLSLIALVFLPMIGSTVGLGWSIPNTVVGWIVWVITKLIIAALNVMIFHCFMQQAKLNIKNNPEYIRALKALNKIKDKKIKLRSPAKWNAEQYGKKGTSIFITSALSVFALTQAILSFDLVMLFTYLFTIVMGIIFGIMQMKSAEEYWTVEFVMYVDDFIERKQQEELELEQKQEQVDEQTTENLEEKQRCLEQPMEKCTET